MAFAPTKAKKERKMPEGIPLTSLMDAMTIILLFLLQQFNASGDLVTPAEGLKIPESVNTDKPKKMLTIIATADHLLVENELICEGEELNFGPTSDFQIPKLYDKLNQKADELQELDSKLFTGDLLIQADINIEYRYVVRMIYSAAQAGYSKIKFVTVQKG